MNNDVLTEILLLLPVQSLLKCRAVCKFWYDVIDSSSFQKLHTHNNSKSDDTVCLQFILSNDRIRVQHNTNSLISYNCEYLKGLGFGLTDDRVRLYGPVKGLISIDFAKRYKPLEKVLSSQLRAPIAICNPFLRQLKLLPPVPTTSSNFSCRVPKRSVALGYADDDFKVVQLSQCDTHHCLHAHVYSRNTDSWRELAVDDDLQFRLVDPIKAACKNGHFAHWHTTTTSYKVSDILSFDMKNEVFRRIKLTSPFKPSVIFLGLHFYSIFAKDEHSFLSFYFKSDSVYIYETRCEGSEWSWNNVTIVEMPCIGIEIIPRWETTFVVIEHWRGATFVYDYREGKFICQLPKGALLIEYSGGLVSL